MEDSRKGKRDGERELETPSPHVDDEKGKKKTIVYKTKKKKEKGDEKNQISKACPKRLFAKNYAHSFSFFTLKSNILAQDSD